MDMVPPFVVVAFIMIIILYSFCVIMVLYNTNNRHERTIDSYIRRREHDLRRIMRAEEGERMMRKAAAKWYEERNMYKEQVKKNERV